MSPDHPRSRGVYERGHVQALQRAGSSPLARGLRGSCCRGRLRWWIIPARAGFTKYGPFLSVRAADHPRSRGVYHWRYAIVTPGTGSSPLARGLPVVRRADHRLRGIIPARAGFTDPTSAAPSRWTDHPRSRGVYTPESQPVTAKDGSSPLARGLRPACTAPHSRVRIIPARAGFTQVRHHVRPLVRDHPRSRGVY